VRTASQHTKHAKGIDDFLGSAKNVVSTIWDAPNKFVDKVITKRYFTPSGDLNTDNPPYGFRRFILGDEADNFIGKILPEYAADFVVKNKKYFKDVLDPLKRRLKVKDFPKYIENMGDKTKNDLLKRVYLLQKYRANKAQGQNMVNVAKTMGLLGLTLGGATYFSDKKMSDEPYPGAKGLKKDLDKERNKYRKEGHLKQADVSKYEKWWEGLPWKDSDKGFDIGNAPILGLPANMYGPLLALAAIGTGMGGYKLGDKLTDSALAARKKRDRKRLEKEFTEVLSNIPKTAMAQRFDTFAKLANGETEGTPEDKNNNVTASALNLFLLSAGLLALAGGGLGARFGYSTSKGNVRHKALKKQLALRKRLSNSNTAFDIDDDAKSIKLDGSSAVLPRSVIYGTDSARNSKQIQPKTLDIAKLGGIKSAGGASGGWDDSGVGRKVFNTLGAPGEWYANIKNPSGNFSNNVKEVKSLLSDPEFGKTLRNLKALNSEFNDNADWGAISNTVRTLPQKVKKMEEIFSTFDKFKGIGSGLLDIGKSVFSNFGQLGGYLGSAFKGSLGGIKNQNGYLNKLERDTVGNVKPQSSGYK
jgi:hypothetical protein